MKMMLPIDKKTAIQGAKVAALVGAGAAVAQVGSELAKRGLSFVGDFAAQGEAQEAIVDIGAGILGAGAGLLILGKITSPAKAKAFAPFVAAGVVGSALAPIVMPRVMAQLESLVDKVLPASSAPAAGVGGRRRMRLIGGVSREVGGVAREVGGGVAREVGGSHRRRSSVEGW
jgi:hypothetical protein